MTNSKKLFIIGLTIFLSVIILIVGMFYLQDISIKNSNYSFNVIFNETPGLYEGDDVKMFGKKIGVITDIRIIDKKVTVELSIDNSFAFKIPIDSKLSLEAFDQAMETSDKSQRKSLEEKHANNCRTLMRNLSKQEYHKQFDGPIEFVVMFIGSEPAYQMALKHDGKLFLDGADKKVFVVSPLSLLPLLSLVSEAWRQFQLSTNANQAIQIAKDLTDRLKIYEDKYQTVGSRILALGKAYNSSVSSYNARLKPSVRNLQKLQGQPEDLMDMESVPVDVTPVIESLEADNEEE